jgi:hypothetical protein
MTGIRKLGIVIALMAPTLAMAATPAPSAKVRAACSPDAKRLCGAVIRDPEARHNCMVAHRAQLSEACKAALAENKKAPLAADVPPGAAEPPAASAPPETPAAAPSGASAPNTK